MKTGQTCNAESNSTAGRCGAFRYRPALGAATNAVAALTCARELGAGRRRPLELVSLEVDLAPLRRALADPAGFSFLQPFREPAEALIREGTWKGEGLRWRLLLGNALSHLEGPPANPERWTEGCSHADAAGRTPPAGSVHRAQSVEIDRAR